VDKAGKTRLARHEKNCNFGIKSGFFDLKMVFFGSKRAKNEGFQLLESNYVEFTSYSFCDSYLRCRGEKERNTGGGVGYTFLPLFWPFSGI
jgi:hypothetical protein